MGQTTTEDREIGSFPRGATALLGLLNYVTTRVGGAKQEEGEVAAHPRGASLVRHLRRRLSAAAAKGRTR